jgi:peptide deformylase
MNEDKTETTTKEEPKFRLHTIVSDQDVVILRKESEPLTATEINSGTTKELIQALKDYVIENDGLGMSAIQLGIAKRLFVVRKPFSSDNLLVIINPRIIRGEGKSSGVENCFSIDNLPENVKGAVVQRQSLIVVEFTDEHGILQTEELFVGMDARIFQHELDHLNGELILDDKTSTGKFQGWRRLF